MSTSVLSGFLIRSQAINRLCVKKGDFKNAARAFNAKIDSDYIEPLKTSKYQPAGRKDDPQRVRRDHRRKMNRSQLAIGSSSTCRKQVKLRQHRFEYLDILIKVVPLRSRVTKAIVALALNEAVIGGF